MNIRNFKERLNVMEENGLGQVGTPKKTRAKRGELSRNEMKRSSIPKRFRSEWLEDPQFKGWLRRCGTTDLKCQCICCNVILKSGKSDLEKHSRCRKHQNNVKTLRSMPTIGDMLANSKSSDTGFTYQVQQAELKLSAFFAEHNIAFQIIDHLTPVLKSAYRDSKFAGEIKLKKTKCENLITQVIAPVETTEHIKELQSVPFSVLVDESTDISSRKSLCILTRYVSSNNGFVKTHLLDLVELDARDCSAINIYKSFKKTLDEKQIPIGNIIGLACDGTNVMIGRNNSLYSNLKDKCPGLILMQCICHSSALIASKACEVLPRSPEDLVQSIATYISGSAKRSAKLVELQEYMNVDRKKMTKVSRTRWLVLQHSVARILENWSVLENFFLLAVVEDKLKSAELILSELRNAYTKAYLLFLNYVLNYFNKFNGLFQSNKLLLPVLSEYSKKLFRTMTQNFLKPEFSRKLTTDVSDPCTFLELDNVHLGPECEECLKDLPTEGVKEIRLRCLEFYITAAREIKARLPLANNFFDEMAFLNPDVALESERAPYLQCLPTLQNHFKDRVDTMALTTEWRNLPNYLSDEEKAVLKKLSVDQMWLKISEYKSFDDELLFPNISKLASLVLSLPHSNAEAERIFSIVTDVKNKKRNRLR